MWLSNIVALLIVAVKSFPSKGVIMTQSCEVWAWNTLTVRAYRWCIRVDDVQPLRSITSALPASTSDGWLRLTLLHAFCAQ